MGLLHAQGVEQLPQGVGLEQVERAMRQTSHALQRYAADRPRGRNDDRYVFNPRDPHDWRNDRDRDHDRDRDAERRPNGQGGGH